MQTGYLAPELILCMDTYDHRVDIFSYGICALALMAMRVPNSDHDDQQATDQPPFRRQIPGFGLEPAEALRPFLLSANDSQTGGGEEGDETLLAQHRAQLGVEQHRARQ